MGDVSDDKTEMKKSFTGNNLEEFRRSVKKVELPMFAGDDPAGWITRAKIYFRVQNTN